MSRPGTGPNSEYEFDNDGRAENKADNSRACDACRKMKIRCIDKENPPCKRCRHMKLDCRFAPAVVTQRARTTAEQGEATKQRLDSLENQVLSMNQKLDEISSFLLRGVASPRGQGSYRESRTDSRPSSSHGHGHGHGHRHGHGQYMSPGAVGRESSERHSERHNGGLHGPPSASRARSLQFTEHDPDMAAMSPMNRLRPVAPDGNGHEGDRWSGDAAHAPPPTETGPRIVRVDAARGAEVDDPLEAAVRMEPFRLLTMKEEEARLREYRDSHVAKRRRLDGGTGDGEGEGDVEAGSSSLRASAVELVRGVDPVELGFCTEAEGRELYDAFFKHAHPYVPILDPIEDTWDDLRARSPFCITAIILIALRGREGAQPSELMKQVKGQAEIMAKRTLFSPISTLETVQALTLLASWCDSSWRPGCHAMTLAVDMGLFRCLPFLHRMARDPNKSAKDIERQRPLVIGARIWLALVKLTYEMSLTHALPLPYPSPAHYPGHYARELLDHPLSTVFDARLVVSVEMLQVRETVFRPYDPPSRDSSDLEHKLRAVNQEISDRFEYWLSYYDRHGVPGDHFLVKELTSQRAYATIYTNSCALYGVHDKEDVGKLSFERRQWLGSALRAAAFLVASVGRGGQEKNSEFANHYFHVGVVSTARYLIRMICLLPEVCDPAEVSYDLDKLILKLPFYPGVPFTDMLRSCVARARSQGVLPYTELSERDGQEERSAAAPENTALPEGVMQLPQLPIPAQIPQGLAPSPFPWNMPLHNPQQSGLDQFAQVGQVADLADDSILWLNDFNFASWLPVASADPGTIDLGSVVPDTNTWYPGGWFPIPPQIPPQM